MDEAHTVTRGMANGGAGRPPARVLARLIAALVAVVVVVAGVWITGGVITNDFALAMWLATGWMALAGLAAVGLAVRTRAFGLPVLVGYAVTALVLGAYLGSSVLLDNVVDERVASVAPASGNELVSRGMFESVAHSARGVARIVELETGGRVLTLTGFDVDNGPDLRVYLVAGPAATEGAVDDFVDLGALKGNRGNQQYALAGRHRRRSILDGRDLVPRVLGPLRSRPASLR
jgi:hypothetical protein